MNPWLETIAVIMVAALGILAGKLSSRFHKCWWMVGYFVGLFFIAMLAAARCNYSLSFIPPFSWFLAGRTRLVLAALAITMGLLTPLSRLPYRTQRVLTCVLMTLIVGWFCILPFFVPALIKGQLLSIDTRVDSNGVCIQSKKYTCGPAAAVTALRMLGLPAQEGQIAVWAHTSPVMGTLPKCLYTAIQDGYDSYGLKCQYRRFDSVEQLADEGVTLAVVKDTFLKDHCVTVLKVYDKAILVGDPAFGKRLMPREDFEKIWRFSGIVLKRDTTQKI